MAYKGYLKKDAIRNYFPMPNAIFNLGLTTGELAVYAYLMFCENRKTYQCYPSFRTIGAAVDMSRPTVKKHVDGLVEKGLIYTEPTSIFTKAGKNRMEACSIPSVPSKKHSSSTMRGNCLDLRKTQHSKRQSEIGGDGIWLCCFPK